MNKIWLLIDGLVYYIGREMAELVEDLYFAKSVEVTT